LIKEYHTHSPQVHSIRGELIVSNIIDIGDNKYKVITSLETKKIEDKNIIRIDFSTIELNKKTKNIQDSYQLHDYNLIETTKEYIGYFKDIKNIGPFYEELIKITKFDQLEPTFTKVLDRLKILKDRDSNYELAYKKIDQVWSWLGIRIKEMDEDSMSPTLNVPGLSTRVFSSVILSIMEGLKRLLKIKSNNSIDGFEIDSKKDNPGDKRRENIYSRLYDKFFPMLLSSELKYTKKMGPDGYLYLFDRPLVLKDLK